MLFLKFIFRAATLVIYRWCQSKNTPNFEDVRRLILLEEFKKCLPHKICAYLKVQKVITVADAAVLAEEHVLTHRDIECGAQPFQHFLSQTIADFKGMIKVWIHFSTVNTCSQNKSMFYT